MSESEQKTEQNFEKPTGQPEVKIQDLKMNQVQAEVVNLRTEVVKREMITNFLSLNEPLRKLVLEELGAKTPQEMGISFFEDRLKSVIEKIGLKLKNIKNVLYDQNNHEFIKNNRISPAPGEVGGFFNSDIDVSFINTDQNIPKQFIALYFEMTAVHEIAHGNEVMKNIIFKEVFCVDKESMYVQEIFSTNHFKTPEEKNLRPAFSNEKQKKIKNHELLKRVMDPVEVYKIFGPFLFGNPSVDPGLENVKDRHSSNSYAILNLIQFISKIDLIGYIRNHGDKEYCEPAVLKAISAWDQEIADLIKNCTNYNAETKHLLPKIFLIIWNKYKKYLQEEFIKGNFPDPKSGAAGCVEALNLVLNQEREKGIFNKKLKEQQLKRTRLLNQQRHVNRIR